MSSLVVLLPREPATGLTEWPYALTPEGRTLASHGKAPVALLPAARGAGSEITAVVPAQAVAWHRVELPKGTGPGSPRLRAVLEGLLEERLLDDPDTLHFALQPGAQGGHAAWVAVCDRAWLRGALQVLEGADRPVGRIVPEFAPEGEAALAVIGEPAEALVVVSNEDGVIALPLTPASLPLLPALPSDAPRYAEPAVAALAEDVLQHKFTLQQAPQRWLQAAQTRWDLAQFEFASSNRARAVKKLSAAWGAWLRAPQWRPARWAVAVLVLANVVGLNAWAWKERSALEAKREGIRRILTQAFPNVKVVVDAPVQMEREVAALRQATGMTTGRDLEALLAAVAASVPAGRAPTRIDFAPGELRAAGLGLAPNELTAVVASLRAQGFAGVAQGDVLVVTPEDAR